MKIKQRPDRPGVGQLVVTVPAEQQAEVASAIATLEAGYQMKGSAAVVHALLEAAARARTSTETHAARAVRAGLEADLDAVDDFAAEVGAAWQGVMSAVDAVREQRRDL